LRERVDDIPLLVRHFIEKYVRELEKPVEGLGDAAMKRLLEYPFPGNVRELENVIERAVALTRTTVLDVDSLPPSLLNRQERGAKRLIPPEGVDLEALMNRYESELLLEALRATNGVKKRAARLLGISFRSFRYRLEKLGLESPNRTDG